MGLFGAMHKYRITFLGSSLFLQFEQLHVFHGGIAEWFYKKMHKNCHLQTWRNQVNKKKQRVEPLQTREEEATKREQRRRRSNSAWENNSFINPNFFVEEEEANLRERRFREADFNSTLDSLRDTELPPMHLTNDVTWEFNNKDYFAKLM